MSWMGLALGFGLGFGLLCVSLILCGSVAPEDMFCSLKMAQDDEQKCRMLLKDLAQNWQWSHSLTFSWPKQATCPSSISVGWRNTLCFKREGHEDLPKKIQTITEILGNSLPCSRLRDSLYPVMALGYSQELSLPNL